ncbi:MAG: BatD family protein [gamma proteobacterium symbiont of Bathyaustriella thionipta]|nr:BatD family protein [gamma proteobacterium symbiont of Bathyaustriella thionipta]
MKTWAHNQFFPLAVSLALLLLCLPMTLVAQPPPSSQFRPMPQTNAVGVPPTAPQEYSNYRYQRGPGNSYSYSYSRSWSNQQGSPPYPGQQTQSRMSGSQPPEVKFELDAKQAYVHQNLIASIDVISSSNLKTLNVQAPPMAEMVFRELGERSASAQTLNGKQQIVTRLYYQLTALQAGVLQIPSLTISGMLESGTPFKIQTPAGQQLEVLPANASVSPWLPLSALEVSAKLINDEDVREGKPLTLSIEQRAEGMSGSQLPSPESQLRSKNHRLYREATEVSGTISQQGRLIGTRIDRFTLVPQTGNMVQIPSVRIEWWNVNRQRKEIALLPGRLLNPQLGLLGNAADGFSGDSFLPGIGWLLWLPLAVIAFTAGLYWTWIRSHSRQYSSRFGYWFAAVSQPVRQWLMTWYYRLSPRRHLHRLRRKFADNLPRSARLWYCVGAADNEQDPDDWSQVLRFLVSRRLGLPAQVPMAQLAEHIIRIHKTANPDKVRELLAELEAALFARQPLYDFSRWKREFKRQIKPQPLRWLFRRRPVKRMGLPQLNP